jgi:molecular chaperone DnaK (HSP70)
MRLGIDFGTTRIVVAAVDRGNYPVVAFETGDGATRDWFPPLVAVNGERRLYGWGAWSTQELPGWTIVRSIKRALEDAGPETSIQLGEQIIPVTQLLSELMMALKTSLTEHSTLPPLGPAEEFEVMLGVPANANSNQRFLTVEAFRKAGFQVLGLLNEPSAASIEFGHRDRIASKGERKDEKKQSLLVYDLGGGTFDVSLVEVDDLTHSVLASEGISTLGGDDFDEVLAQLALDAASFTEAERDGITQAEHFRLHEECRQKKEALHPNTRRIAVDLECVREGWGQVSVNVADFYERCRPLVQETLNSTESLLAANSSSSDSAPIDALYMTGGGSELPLVARVLRESFGRRVRRSAYTRSATAIGLAIQADSQTGYVLREKFMRHFGVWREAEEGRSIVFDPLFLRGTALPGPGDPPLVRDRSYVPVHNIGHFRYLECSHRTDDSQPSGDITIWDEIRFPFDPKLEAEKDLTGAPVMHSVPGCEVAERYSCDASGTVTVTIANLTAGYSRTYRVGRWAAKDAPIVPGRKRKSAAKK